MTGAKDQRLLAAGWLFALGSAVHIVDHLRRGQGSVTDELQWVGTLALVLQAVVVTLLLTRHRLAPLLAVAAGFPLALGFFAAHWLPEWSALSDPAWQIDSWRWFSYVASTTEIVGALAIAVAGLGVVRDRGLASFAVTPQPSA
ncbi:MAG TPA: hypothetical protein VE466_14060 [Acidimicrobiales bacterium]|jgi:hypothetical protein|nr:hypothetical protein [Acidimicrobiales bacterium]